MRLKNGIIWKIHASLVLSNFCLDWWKILFCVLTKIWLELFITSGMLPCTNKGVLELDTTPNAYTCNPSQSNDTHFHASAAEIRVIPGVCMKKQFINYNIKTRKTLMESICGCHGVDLCVSEHSHVFLFTCEWIKTWFINSPLAFPTLSLTPPLPLGINQLSDTCTVSDREADRGSMMGRKMMGEGRRLRGIRVARVKLETYPFNMSYLSILSVKRGTRGMTPMVQKPNSIQCWKRGQLLSSRTNCNGSWEKEMWCKALLQTPATHPEIKGKKPRGETGRRLPYSLTKTIFEQPCQI